MNKPINYLLAKLLKEKRFNQDNCEDYWEEGLDSNTPDEIKLNYYGEAATNYWAAPTIAQVVMWVYEKHGIWIYTVKDYDMPKFNYAIQRPHIYSVITYLYCEFSSPTEAYLAAIEYILNNLI